MQTFIPTGHGYFDLGPTAAGSISITSPTANAVIGKDSSNQADIAISGLYTFGSACHVEARFGTGAFTRVATLGSGTGAAWSGTLSAQAAGPRKTLTVRIEEATSVSASVAMGIGLIFFYLGDSTVQDYYTNTDTYVATSIGVSVKGSNLNDNLWLDGNSAAHKSPGLRIADLLAQQFNMCIGFWVEAHAGTELGEGGNNGWDPTANLGVTGGDFLYNLKFRFMVNSGALRVHAVFCDFGTNAIEGTHPTQSAYTTLIRDFGAWFASAANIAGAPPIFFHLCGEAGTDYTYYDSTRGGVLDAVALGAPVYLGAVIHDQEYHTTGGEADSTHPKTDAHRKESGDRHYLAAKDVLAGSTAVRGPRVSSVTKSGSTITINFDQALGNAVSSSLATAAFAVTDNGTPATITAATVQTASSVRLTLSAPTSGTVLVWYAKQDTASGVTIPTSANRTLSDSTTVQTPAEPFFGVTASPPASQPMTPAFTGQPVNASSRELVMV